MPTLSVIQKVVKFMKALTQKKDQDNIPCSFAYKAICIDGRFIKPFAVFKGENAAYDFIKKILEEYEYCKRVLKKHINKI